jgi:aspartate carbamoyltransferase regulatory subunit
MTHPPNSKKATRTISQIERGTVIDHLDPKVVFTVVRILGIDRDVPTQDTVTVGVNLQSNVLGKKGIIKIANRFLTSEDVNKLSVVSPNATVNIIDDYEVKQKFKVVFPEVVEKILRCPNRNCVTNVEGTPTRFKLVNQEPLLLFCTYCERFTNKDDIEVV